VSPARPLGITSLATIRVILGIAEAGFFPGVILYLTYWFPQRERARIFAMFMVALPVATVIAAPFSGVMLDHVHRFSVESWRWMFVIQGGVAVLVAPVAYFFLPAFPPGQVGSRRPSRSLSWPSWKKSADSRRPSTAPWRGTQCSPTDACWP
jgi:MFS family permease